MTIQRVLLGNCIAHCSASEMKAAAEKALQSSGEIVHLKGLLLEVWKLCVYFNTRF